MTGSDDDVVRRRFREHLIADIEAISKATDIPALRNTELGREVEVIGSSMAEHPAELNEAEFAAVRALNEAISRLLHKAAGAERDRLGGKAVHGVDAETLAAFGWFTTVQPLAEEAFSIFMQRGWAADRS